MQDEDIEVEQCPQLRYNEFSAPKRGFSKLSQNAAPKRHACESTMYQCASFPCSDAAALLKDFFLGEQGILEKSHTHIFLEPRHPSDPLRSPVSEFQIARTCP
jgi:hypothetical protein